LNETLRSTQQGHENIDQLVLRAIFDGLLREMHAAADRLEDAAALELRRQGRQTRMRAKEARERCGRLRHSDPPEEELFTTELTLRMGHFSFLDKLILSSFLGANLDENQALSIDPRMALEAD
jgi:hypothetical protein